jgi:hypothetical protein
MHKDGSGSLELFDMDVTELFPLEEKRSRINLGWGEKSVTLNPERTITVIFSLQFIPICLITEYQIRQQWISFEACLEDHFQDC